MITPLDYDRTWNNREHNMVRYFSRMGCQITLLYKIMNRSARILDLIRDTYTCHVHAIRKDENHIMGIDPFFNYYAGCRMYAHSKTLTSEKKSSVWFLFIKLFSPLAVFRDIFFVPCFLLIAIIKLKSVYHVCIGFGPWGALVGWILQKMGKVQLLVYEDRDFEPGLMPDRLRRSYTAWLEQFLVKRADLIISIGYHLAKLRQLQSGKRISIVPTGVDWDRFHPSRIASKKEKSLIYIGNLISWSGLELAIQAMPKILRSIPSCRLLIVGDGLVSYKNYLRYLVKGLDLKEHILFLGQKPYEELPALLGKSYLGLANSQPVVYRKYAYPLKVIEYMAAGLPIIGTENTETAMILSRYQCGISISYNVDAFANAVITLLKDRDLYHQMRSNGIRSSAEMKWETLLAKELDLIGTCYAEITAQKKKIKPLSFPNIHSH